MQTLDSRVPETPHPVLPRLRNLHSYLVEDNVRFRFLFPALIVKRALRDKEISFDEMMLVIGKIEADICCFGLCEENRKAHEIAWDIIADIPIPFVLRKPDDPTED